MLPHQTGERVPSLPGRTREHAGHSPNEADPPSTRGSANIVDEEAVQEMMSFFPARDVEEPVTKEFLRAEMADLRAELTGGMSSLRSELRGELSELRSEFKGEMSAMEHRLIERINRAQAWNFLAMIAFAGTIIAAVRI